jgi:hypothetical protein
VRGLATWPRFGPHIAAGIFALGSAGAFAGFVEDPWLRRGTLLIAAVASIAVIAATRGRRVAWGAVATAGVLLGVAQPLIELTGPGSAPTPRAPQGFARLHSAWVEAQQLNEQLVRHAVSLNEDLIRGTGWHGDSITPASVAPELRALRETEEQAASLAGRTSAIVTPLYEAREDLTRLSRLCAVLARYLQDQFWEQYQSGNGSPLTVGSAGFSPTYSDALAEAVYEQAGLATRIRAALLPRARRWERSIPPKIRGWQRIAIPTAPTDSPIHYGSR